MLSCRNSGVTTLVSAADHQTSLALNGLGLCSCPLPSLGTVSLAPHLASLTHRLDPALAPEPSELSSYWARAHFLPSVQWAQPSTSSGVVCHLPSAYFFALLTYLLALDLSIFKSNFKLISKYLVAGVQPQWIQGIRRVDGVGVERLVCLLM